MRCRSPFLKRNGKMAWKSDWVTFPYFAAQTTVCTYFALYFISNEIKQWYVGRRPTGRISRTVAQTKDVSICYHYSRLICTDLESACWEQRWRCPAWYSCSEWWSCHQPLVPLREPQTRYGWCPEVDLEVKKSKPDVNKARQANLVFHVGYHL